MDKNTRLILTVVAAAALVALLVSWLGNTGVNVQQ
jgi:hypothetical protein